MTIWFHNKAYGLPGQRLLAGFTVPGMNSLLWRRPRIQRQGSWLPHDSHATLLSVETFCLAGQYCGVQSSARDKTFMFFLSQKPTHTFQRCGSSPAGSFGFIFLCPEAIGCLQQKELTYSYSGQPRAMG